MSKFKIYGTSDSGPFARVWFDINGDRYDWIDDVTDERIDFNLQGSQNINARITLDLDIYRSYEDKNKELVRRLDHDPTLVIVTESFDPNVHHPRLIFNDFMFNRTKAYYSHFPIRSGGSRWFHHGHLAFMMMDLRADETKRKIFVSPSQIGPHKYRRQIIDLLWPYQQLGYLGCKDVDETKILYSHVEFPYPNFKIEDLESQTRRPSYDWWGYAPPHNLYYQNTFLSIYGESVEWGSTLFVSEKTLDPMIKGHFILPFSSAGFIPRVRQQGFQLPDFIDYSYDSIQDDQRRFDAFADETRRLLSLDLDTWHQHWLDHQEMLYLNQRLFFTRDYDRVDLQALLDRFG